MVAIVRRIAFLALVVVGLAAALVAVLFFRGEGDLSEASLQQRLCRGMSLEFVLPDRTRIDCLSATHAIEVDFWDNWYEAIGQSLHYALWTAESAAIRDRSAGIILVCRSARELCSDYAARFFRILDRYRLPITVWDCATSAESLAECRVTGPA